MPNWCMNGATISHDDPKMLKKAKQAFDKHSFFNEYIPIPKPLLETMSGWHNDPEKQAQLEAQMALNKEKYGYSSWYEFCVEEWGTKWEVGGGDDSYSEIFGDSMDIAFNSAWTPPLGVYKKMQELGFKITAYYYEPGCGFAGRFDENGDFYVEFDGETEAGIKKICPADIWENIVEPNFCEYEE